jgi:citrate lyase subunit alpha/citrate CoA-transferase
MIRRAVGAIGREAHMDRLKPHLPQRLEGYGALRAYRPIDQAASIGAGGARPSKLLASLDAAIGAAQLADGATLSFHHHLRNGDGVLNAVLAAAAQRGLKSLHVAATSIFPVHAPLVEHIRRGVVRRLSASFIAGPVGEAVSRGLLADPVVLRAGQGEGPAGSAPAS